MIPIISHGKAGNNGYTFDDFESNFLKICDEHRENKRALAFALILYDFAHPQVAKTLKDKDYWLALDKISGQYLSVFSFHTKPGTKERIPKPRARNKNVIHCMVSVLAEQFKDGRTILEKYFDLGTNVKLPAILFFQVSNSEIIGTSLVQLKKEKKEDSFIEIKNIISVAAEAVSEVKEEYFENDHEIFSLIENKLNDRGFILNIIKVVKKTKSVKGILSLFW